MAKALDYDEDEELIFQMQLEEIRKISNPKEETGVLCDLFPRFCQIYGNVERNDYPTKLSQFNPEFTESQGSSREKKGGFRDTFKPKISSPMQYNTSNPCNVLRCYSIWEQSYFENDPQGRIRNVDQDLNPRENLFGVKLSSNDYKSYGDRLIAEQVQFEMDNEIATELEKNDINNTEEQGRILAEYMQLESDLESANELGKQINTTETSRGLEYHPQLIRDNGARLLRRPSFDFPADDIEVDGLDYETMLELQEQIGEVKSLGLQHSDIETLPKETITNLSQIEKKQCCICLEDFRLNDIVRKLPCLHRYHIDCIDCWLKRKAECPVCRKNVKGSTSKNGSL